MSNFPSMTFAIERDELGVPTRIFYGSGLSDHTVAMSPQDRLRQRYQTARQVWRDNSDVQSAAAMIGMTEREYCDRYIEVFGPMLGTCTTDTLPPPLDRERAYQEAKP